METKVPPISDIHAGADRFRLVATDGAPAGWLEDYSREGSGRNKRIGIVFVHGFTGSPASMRPWAHYFEERGFTVRVPRIPGHGTKWQDLNEVEWQEWPAKVEREIAPLVAWCEKVFIFGLSMGGANTLHVAARMAGTAAAASGVFTVMRTSSDPACASSLTWIAVSMTSTVSVLVMDCTRTGASAPMVST